MLHRMFNVVFTGNLSYPNGLAGTRRVQLYVDHLRARNIDVSVLILMGKPVLPGNEKMAGNHRGVPYLVTGQSLKFGWQLPLEAYRYYCESVRFLREHWQKNAINILFHYGQPEVDNIHLLLKARCMGYLIIHDLVEDYDVLSEWYKSFAYNCRVWTKKRLSRYIPMLSDGLVVISRHLERKYIACGLPMVRIPISAEVKELSQTRKRHSPVRIAYAGTFGTKDGIHVLLEAYQLVRRQYPDCILRLAGGSHFPRENFPREITVGVEYAGYLESKAFYEFLDDADILCMTRLNSAYANAGFPFKLGEYLATGHPVVASRVSNLDEYLEDRRDVLMVKPESSAELCGAILFLLQNPEDARAIGTNGRQACIDHFDPRRNGDKLLELLEAVATRSRQARS